MSLRRADLLRLLEQSRIDLRNLESSIEDTESMELEELIGLSRKLPSGFIHADALWLIANPPADFEPLAPGSAWYAVGRELMVVVPSGERWNAVEILQTVYAYFRAAGEVHRRLSNEAGLVDALLSGERFSPEEGAQCALKLDAPIDFFQQIEEQSPELKFDLGWMGRREFAPTVNVHSSLRPQVGRRRGEESFRKLIQVLPEGPIQLVLSDDDGVFDPVSPYVRDLSESICQWASENKDSLSTDELHEKIQRDDGEYSSELATIALPDLLKVSSEILDEKRAGEAQAGLHFIADGSLKMAWASTRYIDGVEPRIGEMMKSAGEDVRVVVLSSASEETLLSVVRLLLATKRVIGVAGIFSIEGEHWPGVVSTNCFVGPDEGVELIAQKHLVNKAKEEGVEIECLSVIDLDSGPRFNLTAYRLAAMVHRQHLVQGIDGSVSGPYCLLTLYRKPTDSTFKPFRLAWSRMDAHRLGFLSLFEPIHSGGSSSNYLKSRQFRV